MDDNVLEFTKAPPRCIVGIITDCSMENEYQISVSIPIVYFSHQWQVSEVLFDVIDSTIRKKLRNNSGNYYFKQNCRYVHAFFEIFGVNQDSVESLAKTVQAILFDEDFSINPFIVYSDW